MSFKKMNIRRLMEFSRTNGRIENRSATPNRYQINQANGVLDHIGVVEQPKENFTTNKCAEIYLYGINCAITSERIDFSLLQNQTDRDYKFLALGLMQNMALKKISPNNIPNSCALIPCIVVVVLTCCQRLQKKEIGRRNVRRPNKISG